MKTEAAGFTRREFLNRAAATIAVAVVTPTTVLGAAPATLKKPKTVRIGVVGGGFGSSLFWHEHPNCIVEAVSDLIPARREYLKKVYRCDKSYDSLEQLITDKNVDAVAVFTGAPDHVEHVVACMKAGKHVICAVPAAMSMQEAEELLDVVKSTGLIYMMAETSWYVQPAISARKWHSEGKFGDIYHTQAEYYHPGVESYWYDDKGQKTWRYGYAPMLYPTHSTAYLIGVTGERLTEVMCIGQEAEQYKNRDNRYKNPFMAETAFFKTNRGNSSRVSVQYKNALPGAERAEWYGTKMSFIMRNPIDGKGPHIIHSASQKTKDSAGFEVGESRIEEYTQVNWWETDILPKPLRHGGGHDGSQSFLTHEFIDALINERRPAIDIYQSLALTVPGIIAHESALQGGRQMSIPTYEPT